MESVYIFFGGWVLTYILAGLWAEDRKSITQIGLLITIAWLIGGILWLLI